ncbi:MAG: hypothetical protein ABI607_00420 [Betaproteobacteria bacterium]
MTLRPFRLTLALVAAAMHLVAPAVAYAKPATPKLPGDLCSVVRPAAPAPAGSGTGLPTSHEHHCAHAPCCAGGAVDAAASPPPVATLPLIVVATGAKLAADMNVARVVPIVAAQPRGPPVLA